LCVVALLLDCVTYPGKEKCCECDRWQGAFGLLSM
jgi:hypothetical protein